MTALKQFVNRVEKIIQSVRDLGSVYFNLADSGVTPMVNAVFGKLDSRGCIVADLHVCESGALALLGEQLTVATHNKR